MAGNPSNVLGDDFFEQILAVPPSSYIGGGAAGGVMGSIPMGLQPGSVAGGGLRGFGMIPLGLNLEQSGFLKHDNGALVGNAASSNSGIDERDSVHMSTLFPAFGHLQAQSLRPMPPPQPAPPRPQLHQSFHSQLPPGSVTAVPHPPVMRPRVRARRGQATDPHSIAERLRRERIAERMKALQELVPSANKSDRAAMLDEIVDYVKFLRLQVKVLSMSRLGGAGAVAQLVADVPLSSIEGDSVEGGISQHLWEKWSTDGTEEQVAKLMEEDVGAAMQFLQSKALCIMPTSLASAIFQPHQPEPPTLIKPESDTQS